MRSLAVATAVVAFARSAVTWPANASTIILGASEPIGLVMWGLTLFAIASGMKRRNRSRDAVAVAPQSLPHVSIHGSAT